MNRFLALILTILSIVFYYHSNAATVIPMELSDLVNHADRIVIARCIEKESFWRGEDIVTENTVLISQTLLGGEEFFHKYVVTTLGGTAKHPTLKVLVNMEVPGGESFKLNEEVILFTKQNQRGVHQVVGLTQGKFAIETDASSGKKVIPVGYKVLSNQGAEEQDVGFIYSPLADFSSKEERIKVRRIELVEFVNRVERLLMTQ